MFNFILQKNKIFIAPAILFVLIAFNFNIGTANAYFSDSTSMIGNTLTAGTLDISLDTAGTFSSDVLYPSDTTTTSISLANTGSLDSQYSASTTLSGSDTSACDYVTMTATSPGYAFTGLIKDFTSSATSTTGAVWNYTFTIDPNAPPSVWGKTCFFKWTYTAWQDDLSTSSSGFSSVKEKLGAIRIGKAVVLNEFISNPTGLDNAPMPGGEWVELYNNSNVSFDLNGWVLYDNTDSHELYITNSNTNTLGTTISPHGFLVVYRNGDSDFNLNNNADSVRLATGYPITTHTLVDSYTYTTEKPEGYSFARIPDGVGAWVDPIPTPGMSNESEDEILPEEIIETVESVEPEGILPASPEEGIETENVAPSEVITDIPPATEPEDVVTEVSETIEPEPVVESAPIPEPATVVEPEPVPEPEPVIESEPVIEPASVVESSAVEPAAADPAPVTE